MLGERFGDVAQEVTVHDEPMAAATTSDIDPVRRAARHDPPTLGAALESERAVRAAGYGYRPTETDRGGVDDAPPRPIGNAVHRFETADDDVVREGAR